MCKLISYVVAEGPPFYANGPVKGVTRCEEHHFMMDGIPVGDGDLCPIGRIELAVEHGLERIQARIDGRKDD